MCVYHQPLLNRLFVSSTFERINYKVLTSNKIEILQILGND